MTLDAAASVMDRSADDLARYESGDAQIPVGELRAMITEYALLVGSPHREPAGIQRGTTPDLFGKVNALPAEGSSLEPDQLNVVTRFRAARLPWRGQFAPELVEYLMDKLFSDASHFYDPFCGSGTVLFEAIRRGSSSVGSEINPAAWHMAALSSFGGLATSQKRAIITELRRRLASLNASSPTGIDKLIASSPEGLVRLATAAAIIIAMGDGATLTSLALARGYAVVLKVLLEIEPSVANAKCLLSDARSTVLESESVDGVITSPPYINVFNYHQNFRPAVEALGWSALQAARSEIGANRKFRGNRFMTVIQYALDMHLSLNETARVMRTGSTAVVVLGRTSNVLGTPFENGKIIRQLVELTGSLELVQKAERVFVNRFGERIREDIVVARKTHAPRAQMEGARQIGVAALAAGTGCVPDKNRAALCEAIERAEEIEPSPIFVPLTPPQFASG